MCVNVRTGLALRPCRVLELDPESADALLGLAMIAFGSTNVQEGLNSGLQYLQRAYVADAAHPGVLCVLSHFSMLKGMYEEVRGLGMHALLMCSCAMAFWGGGLAPQAAPCIWLLSERSGASGHAGPCGEHTDGCPVCFAVLLCRFVCACRASSSQRLRY